MILEWDSWRLAQGRYFSPTSAYWARGSTEAGWASRCSVKREASSLHGHVEFGWGIGGNLASTVGMRNGNHWDSKMP